MTERIRVAVRWLLEFCVRWLLDGYRATYGLAVMRIGYGVITVAVLVLHLPYFSYSFGEASAWATPLKETSIVNGFPWPLTGIFSREDSDGVLLAKYIVLILVALLFTVGWRMRIIAPLFLVLWLSFSTVNPLITNTGHFQTFRVMLIFLVFADLSRRWSLDARRRRLRAAGARTWLQRMGLGRLHLPERLTWGGRPVVPSWLPPLLNNGAVLMIAFQLIVIYVASALWKVQGSTWLGGYAVYYPLRVEELALFPGLNEFLWHLTPVILVSSWATVYFQLFFPVLLLNRWTRIFALIGITGMHIGIAVLLSLPFFSAVMLFADAVFVRDSTWRWMLDWIGDRLPRRRRRRRSGRRRMAVTTPGYPV